jgi:hypothetical protein
MNRRIGVPYLAVLASLAAVPLTGTADAADLPPIKSSDANKVAECATPGRLMAYLRSRNEKLDARYEGLATEYMRHGETLGIRWDYAFFQMLLETGYLRYTGDVKAEQNNFAGLGATGGGVRGESFKDVSSGARAHLEHVLMYSGATVENPVAQRTRDVQSWGVLTSWQKSIGSPITYAHLASKWAPGTKAYASDVKTIADRFFAGPCKGEDPNPEMIALARGESPAAKTAAAPAAAEEAAATTAATAQVPPKAAAADTSPATAAPGAGEPPADMTTSRAGLGASSLAVAGNTPPAPPAASPSAAAPPPAVTILNQGASPTPDEKEAGAQQATTAPAIETASVAGAAKDAAAPAKKAPPKCRVWTASYGGAKAIIIKATADQTTNYTVLDVNEGAEQREADAYINAYAKGGERVGEFSTQSQALDKAFELCPEG